MKERIDHANGFWKMPRCVQRSASLACVIIESRMRSLVPDRNIVDLCREVLAELRNMTWNADEWRGIGDLPPSVEMLVEAMRLTCPSLGSDSSGYLAECVRMAVIRALEFALLNEPWNEEIDPHISIHDGKRKKRRLPVSLMVKKLFNINLKERKRASRASRIRNDIPPRPKKRYASSVERKRVSVFLDS